MKLTWLTDIHLDFLTLDERKEFHAKVKEENPDYVLITGDIATAKKVSKVLLDLQKEVGSNVLYVLGNHDFYDGSIKEVKKILKERDRDLPLRYLHGDVIQLEGLAIVGIDGMGDARLGDPRGSRVAMNDWNYIKEMVEMQCRFDVMKRIEFLKFLGDCEAQELEKPLRSALEVNQKVIVLTHIPPWKEATWHLGRYSDDDHLPWFSCAAVGAMIEKVSSEFPGKSIQVYCGHTHGNGYSRISDDIEVFTGHAEYYSPQIQATFEI